MAKRKTNLEMTPLMTLSALAIFAMMPIMISIVNNRKSVNISKTAAPVVVVTTPVPSASPVN